MSGSKCKTRDRTGSQDITNARVAEMIELAAILTNHPDAAKARAALSRIANELLTNRSDSTIERAIQAAPSCGIAQTLQRAVEAASERVVILRDGVRAELSLFAIPIIATFEQNVPESQFESSGPRNGSSPRTRAPGAPTRARWWSCPSPIRPPPRASRRASR